jgi:hypothetical protein
MVYLSGRPNFKTGRNSAAQVADGLLLIIVKPETLIGWHRKGLTMIKAKVVALPVPSAPPACGHAHQTWPGCWRRDS